MEETEYDRALREAHARIAEEEKEFELRYLREHPLTSVPSVTSVAEHPVAPHHTPQRQIRRERMARLELERAAAVAAREETARYHPQARERMLESFRQRVQRTPKQGLQKTKRAFLTLVSKMSYGDLSSFLFQLRRHNPQWNLPPLPDPRGYRVADMKRVRSSPPVWAKPGSPRYVPLPSFLFQVMSMNRDKLRMITKALRDWIENGNFPVGGKPVKIAPVNRSNCTEADQNWFRKHFETFSRTELLSFLQLLNPKLVPSPHSYYVGRYKGVLQDRNETASERSPGGRRRPSLMHQLLKRDCPALPDIKRNVESLSNETRH
jgi:hypothetical protein